jgi:malonyl-CoA O-methyltransferase
MKTLVQRYDSACWWIKENTIPDAGISTTSKNKIPYPEVSGYYIPTLLKWGMQDLAKQYTKWLCIIQKDDGSWYDAYDKYPYVFDTAQILKGLLAISTYMPEVESHIIKGCDWLISNVHEDGRFTTPKTEIGHNISRQELIHIYCLSPLIESDRKYDKSQYGNTSKKSFGIL